ncbi:MAG: TRAP transporter large permease [Longicatena sp.]
MIQGILVLFIILLLISVPIACTLGIVSITPSLIDPNFQISVEYIIRSMLGGIDSFPLLAVPMFVLSGILMAKGGVSKKLFDVFSFFLGKHTGGMPCAVIVTCLFYGAISGSAPATVAAVGSMTIPLLIRMGYDKTFVTALVAVAGGLGVIIPPSIPFILYGMASGASVGKMFMAGIVPGLLIASLLMLYAIYHCKRYGEDSEKIDLEVNALHEKGFKKVFLDSFWALLTPVIILGCIYTGVASPTEAAVISVFVYRTLKFSDLKGVLVESIRTFAPILFILAAAVAFSRVITLLQIPQSAGDFILHTFSGKVSVLIVINILLLIVGMVMDTSPAILILTPILLPITNALGIDPVHFGIIMVVNLAIGFVTPPIGINLFVASSLTEVPVMQIARKAAPLIAIFLLALLVITFVPAISLCLVG